ncbi:hypothetical protein CEW81_24765 [Kluyvera genomosp. 3]|uniref:Uncharacterized protein n=1 Tax=Kluyvera genomosp. 3 TaxID=2774055 RepID=A0A248KM46_9ENTR|nr:hypothetical protein CEW81_24765 [Kluyvera genomosp. 3]
MVFIFRLATLRIRIFECPHRLSDKLLKSSCDAAYSSPSRGGVYYAFLFQSQAFNFAFLCRSSQENLADPAACLPLFRVSGSAL